MKTMRLFVLAILTSMVFISGLAAQSRPKGIKAYLSVSLQGKAIENIKFQQAGIADSIKDILSSEGINILSNDDIGKPGEPNLNIYVSLKDSLEINAASIEDGGNHSVLTISYPMRSYEYNTIADITRSVRKYIKDYIKLSPKKGRK